MTPEDTAKDRASMPSGTNRVLDHRTIENDNRNLLPLLRKGISVLDVGCGSGAISCGIAKRISSGGYVTGIDISEELISQAKERYQNISNLFFKADDIYSYHPNEKFDLITSARVLQWLAHPKKALINMKNLLNENGCISILDYNHEKIKWVPAIPETMDHFYNCFLQWRKDAGFDNAIADHLETIFSETGFSNISTENQFELAQNTDTTFSDKTRIWAIVAETRGKQLVKDDYITDAERIAAIKDYDNWILNDGQSMQMYLLAVAARL